MKREFLNNLELDQDVINQIMAEHGKTVKAIQDGNREELDALNSKLAAKDAKVYELEAQAGQVDVLQSTLDKLKEEAEATKGELKEARIDQALIEAGANDLEYTKFKLGEVELDNLEDAVKALKETIPNQFQSSPEVPGYKPINNGPLDPARGKGTVNKEDIMAIKDTEKRQKMIEENIDLFKE